jgi:hypothetical protein
MYQRFAESASTALMKKHDIEFETEFDVQVLKK